MHVKQTERFQVLKDGCRRYLMRLIACCLMLLAYVGNHQSAQSAWDDGALSDVGKHSSRPLETQENGTGSRWSGQDTDTQQDSDIQQQIGKWIEELGDSSFAVRQAAADRLWKTGDAAIGELERAARQTDPEVARRASQILSVLALGVDATTSPRTAKMILNFNFGDTFIRNDILQHLIRDEEVRLVYQLLGQIDDVTDQGTLFHLALDFNNVLIQLARADRWEDIEFMLGHPITLEHEPATAIHFHLVNGTLPNVLEQLIKSLLAKTKLGQSVEASQWLRVISILRMQRRFDDAEQWAKNISDVEIRNRVRTQILLEKGDWEAVARRMVIAEATGNPGDDEIVVSHAQAALVNQFVGNQQGYQQVIAPLSRKAEQLERAEDREGAKSVRAQLRGIGLANLDWPLVEANLDHDDSQQMFNLYIDHQRVGQAFAVIGLGQDLAARTEWFKQKVRLIKSLVEKIKRLNEKNEDTDDVEVKLRREWQLCLDVADRLGGFGLTDEAVLHYHSLFSTVFGTEDRTRRIEIIARLIYLEQYADAWSLVQYGIESREIRQVFRFFFPAHQHTSASYWNTILANRYPDPVQRIKAVSGMLNSPLGTTPEFDLSVELAIAQADLTRNATGYLDLQIGLVLEYHGDFVSSIHHLNLAKQLGNDAAKRTLSLRAFEQKDFHAAAEYYESAWRYRTSAFDSCFSAEANRQLGNIKRATLRQCIGYAYWRDSYRHNVTIESLEALNQTHLIEDFLKLDVYCIEGNAIANERYRSYLADAQREHAPAISAIEKQVILFNQCGNNEPSAYLLHDWADTRLQINQALAKDRIVNGRFDEAVELLIQCDEFIPGDPGLGETAIAELDQAGAILQADRLFGHLSRFYLEILAEYPDSALHHNNYAWLGVCAKRQTQAMLRHAEKAVSERPNTSSYLDTLATVSFQLGDKSRASRLCRRCIELNPEKKHYRDQLKLFESE